jgi:hypothetical protein
VLPSLLLFGEVVDPFAVTVPFEAAPPVEALAADWVADCCCAAI